MSDRRQRWEQRYADRPDTGGRPPNGEVEQVVGRWLPGAALDLGAGEGRHALWLAGLGWQVTAVDFSAVALARGRAHAAVAGLDIDWQVADVDLWEPDSGRRYDLVLVTFLHLDVAGLRRAATWLAPGGALVVVAHARRNLSDGVGGPRNPALRYSPEELRDGAAGLHVERCEEVVRSTDGGAAAHVVLVARAAG